MRFTQKSGRRLRAAFAWAAAAALALNIGAVVMPHVPAAQAAPLDTTGFDINYSPDVCSRAGTTGDDYPTDINGGANPDMRMYPNIMTGTTPNVTPEKDDICGVWEGTRVDDNGHVLYYLAWDISKSPTGTMSSIQILESPTSPDRDIALDIDYSPSGGATVKAHRYSSATGTFTQIGAGFAVGYHHYPSLNKFEIILDLTAAGVFSEDVCESFTSGYLYSRTSDSFTATLKDQAGGGTTIYNCGDLIVEKVGFPELGTGITDAYDFAYTIDRAGGGIVLPADGETPAKTKIEDSLKIGGTDTFTGVIRGGDYRLVEADLAADNPWKWTSTVCTVGDDADTYELDNTTSTTFPVVVGQTTHCTITNTTSLLEVDKVAHGDQEQDFVFDVAGWQIDPITITGTGTSGTYLVKPGTAVTITEREPVVADGGLAWYLDSIEGGTVDLAKRKTTLTTVAGQTVTATFTNSQKGRIVVIKEVEGTTADATFGFAADWTTGTPLIDGGEFSITTAAAGDGTIRGEQTFTEVDPGEYSLSEIAPDGFDLTNVVCSDPDQGTVVGDDLAATIDLDAGETVTCTFTNTQRGKIELDKDTVPADYDQDFGFTITGPGGYSEDVTLNDSTDDEAAPWSTGLIKPGEYTITEDAVNGWTLTAVTVNGETYTAVNGAVTVTLKPGDVVRVVVTNTATPTELTVAKQVDGIADGFAWSFDFTVTGPNDYAKTETISSEAGDPVTFTDLVPGATYTLTEGQVEGWTQGAPVCTVADDDGTALPDADAKLDGFQFLAEPGLKISCEFTNTAKPAELELEKTVAGYDGTEWSFDFSLTPAVGDDDGARTVTQDNPTASWTGLIPGTQYTLIETVPEGWTADAPTCDVDDEEADIDGIQFTAQPGQKISCTVTNTAEPATITVVKTTDGGDGAFDFELKSLDTDEVRTITVTTDGGTGSTTLEGIVPGSRWSIRELVPDTGWTAGDLTGTVTGVDGETRDIDVDDFVLNPGDALSLAITNTAHGEIIVIKNVEGADTGFDFTGSWLDGDGGFTITTEDGVGSASFGDLKPGTYTLTELPIDGYDGLTMSCVETTERTASSVEGLTGTLALDPGETITCTVSNAEWGVIVVDKQTKPAGSDASFDFGLAGGDVDGSFSLTDDADPYVQRVAPGDYTVTETPLDGWMLTDASCTDGATRDGDSVTAHVGLGDTVTCTFVNAQRGDLNVDKTVVSGPVLGADGEWTTVYRIDVASESHVDEQYTLTDELRFGDGLDITGVAVTGPEGVVLDAGWNGIDATTLAADATLPALGQHSYTITVTAKVDPAIEHDAAKCAPGGGSGWFNTTTVEYWSGSDDDDACVEQPVANVRIDKTGTDRIVVEEGKGAQAIEYTITIVNDGPATATDVVVTDAIPAEVSFVSATPSVGTCTETGGVLTCELGDLADGATATIAVKGTVADTTKAGTIENVADVTTTIPGDKPGDNRDDHPTVIEVAKKPVPTPAPTTKPGSPLPATGAVFDPTLGWLALALIAAGGGALAIRKRVEQD